MVIGDCGSLPGTWHGDCGSLSLKSYSFLCLGLQYHYCRLQFLLEFIWYFLQPSPSLCRPWKAPVSERFQLAPNASLKKMLLWRRKMLFWWEVKLEFLKNIVNIFPNYIHISVLDMFHCGWAVCISSISSLYFFKFKFVFLQIQVCISSN